MNITVLRLLALVLVLPLAACDSGSLMSTAIAEITPEQHDEIKLPVVGDDNKGKQVAQEQCAGCHGLNGVAANSGAPFIAGLEQDYLVRSLLAYRKGARQYTVMQQIAEQLNPIMLADVTAYYTGLETPWQGAIASEQSKAILLDAQARGAALEIVDGCRSCHSQVNRYQKQEAIPSLDGMPMEYFAPALKSYLTGERNNEIMVKFKQSLSDQDIYNLAAYFAAQVPQKAPLSHNGNPAKGKIAARACAGCHGDDGNSLNPHIPNLAGQSARYLIKATRDYRDGVRSSRLMQEPVQNLSEQTIVDMAAYFSRQQPQSPLHKDITSAKAFNPLAEGEAIAASCNSCHGDNGNSQKVGVPSLTGMHVKYIVKATQAYQQGYRKDPEMTEIVSFFSDTDIEKAAYYYAMQKPESQTQQLKGDINNGKALSQVCRDCHGDTGVSGDPAVIPGLAGQDETYLVTASQAYVSGGRKHQAMQEVMQGLNEQQINDLAAYFSSQSAQAIETFLPDDPARLVEERCSRCHGERGFSTEQGVPRLAGQIESYIVLALKQYQDGQRKDKAMVAMADVLSLLEIKAIAAYYARQ